jgi:5'-deoxynucleotidase
MRHIVRWGLMRNSYQENVQEHSYMTAVLAHSLAAISRELFSGTVDPEHAAAAALFHDASEIFTGDLPTPVKYQNPEIMSAYKDVEQRASEKLLGMLPAELRGTYSPLLMETDGELHAIVKAADKLAAYIKCVEEIKAGNAEFSAAKKQTLASLRAMKRPEVEYFLENFIDAFSLTLDEQIYL